MTIMKRGSEVNTFYPMMLMSSSSGVIKKGFSFLQPKIQVDASMLDHIHSGSKTFHLICGPARCIDIVKAIMKNRAEPGAEVGRDPMVRPIFVWEPAPNFCKPSELPEFYEALKHVDVISPNGEELLKLFRSDVDRTGDMRDVLMRCCNQLLSKGFEGKPGAVVVRLSEHGCWIIQRERYVHMPSYHRRPEELNATEREKWIDRVVDTTGAGNAFLGGYCIGLLNKPHPSGWTEFETAAIYGSVAAGFAIEQLGMPKLSYCEVTRKELWNGEDVRDRLVKYESRLKLPPLSKENIQQASLSNTAKNYRLV